MAPQLNIAVVEDHNDLRHELAELLSAAGHRVTSFADAETFCADTMQYDLYLIDIGLPGEDGLSLAQRVRRRDQKARIFVLTAHDENQKRIDSFRTGVELFLAKPVDPEQLVSAVSLVTMPHDHQAPDGLEFSLDLASGILKGPASAIKLSSSEVALVKRLVDLRQLPLSVAEVADALNVGADHLHTGTLEARISILRKKIVEVGGSRNAIASVRKYGYKINQKILLK